MAKSKDKPAAELTASEVLQRRMGLGKLIADRLANKLSDDDQRAFVKAHAEQNFEAYSQFVAKLQFRGASPPANGEAEQPSESQSGAEPVSEAEAIRRYVATHPDAANKDVVAALAEEGVKVTSSQVSAAKRQVSAAD